MSDSEPNLDVKSIKDILSSETKFKIFSILRIYPEQGLNEIADLLNKSRSTVHEHLQKMIDAGMVIQRELEENNRPLKKKIYSLAPFPEDKVEESCCKPIADDDCTREEKKASARSGLDILLSFVEQQKMFVDMWWEFLHHLDWLYEQDDIDQLWGLLKKIANSDEVKQKLITVDFYDRKMVNELFDRSVATHNELEEKDMKRIKDLSQAQESVQIERPYYGGTLIFPAKIVLETLESLKQQKKKAK